MRNQKKKRVIRFKKRKWFKPTKRMCNLRRMRQSSSQLINDPMHRKKPSSRLLCDLKHKNQNKHKK